MRHQLMVTAAVGFSACIIRLCNAVHKAVQALTSAKCSVDSGESSGCFVGLRIWLHGIDISRGVLVITQSLQAHDPFSTAKILVFSEEAAV